MFRLLVEVNGLALREPDIYQDVFSTIFREGLGLERRVLRRADLSEAELETTATMAGAVVWGLQLDYLNTLDSVRTGTAQHEASGCARRMQQDNAHPAFRVGPIGVGVLRDPPGWLLYLAADARTDHQAITAFYRLNYPRPPYSVDESSPKVQAPRLVLLGRYDRFLLVSGHDRNGMWTKAEPCTVILDAGHFVHQ